MDGTLGSQTARLLDGTGVEITSRDEFEAIVRAATRAGVPVAVHAIGDLANREALDAFAARVPDARSAPRIEHAQCLHPDDIPRFAALGVTASIQPSMAVTDAPVAERLWADRLEGAYAYRSLHASGARLALGSDAPVEEMDPLQGLRDAVLREWRPHEALDLQAALEALTVTPAWLEGNEDRRGRLAPGMLADLVILDRDPFDDLAGASVVDTWLGRSQYGGAHDNACIREPRSARSSTASRCPTRRAADLTSTNPANTSEVVAEVRLADAATFVDACRAARAAQREWAKVPAPARGRVIANVGRLVEANKEALARLVTREVGKPYAESLGEVQEIIDTCDFFLGEGRRLYGQTVPSEMPDKQLFTFRMPVGVAAIITAGNFPVAVPAWYLVPAILCGNAVVWKPAEYSPALGDALAKLFHAGGVPGGVLNVVQAEGAQTFEGLSQALDEGLVDKVGFTGSSAVGSKIGELCGRHLQSPCLELGGKNPMVVMDDADVDLAVEGALFGGFGTAGQRCTSLGTAIVHESVHDEFVRRLDERLRGAPVGDPTQDVLYGPMLHERFAERFEDWLGLIRDHHTTYGSTAQGRITADQPARGLRRRPGRRDLLPPGRSSTASRSTTTSMRRETFGPIIGVATFRDLRRGDGARQRPRLRALVVDLHALRRARVPLPRAHHRRHGVGQQLDVGRRGAPAVRRQRQVRQRLAPVGHLGARPVHPLAVDELGLRGQAPEGPDGRRRDRRAARLQARRARVLERRRARRAQG